VETLTIRGKGKGEGKGIPVQAWIGPEDSRRFKLPGFSDIRHTNVGRLLAQGTGYLYPSR
jgi:hypothetical protein